MNDMTPHTDRLHGDDWVAFMGPPLGFADPVVCRVAEVDDRLRIVELRLGGGGRPVTARALRELPISAMEQLVGSAVQNAGTGADKEPAWVTWSFDALMQFLQQEPEPEPLDPELASRWMAVLYGMIDGEPRYVLKQDPALDWTKGQGITDEFLFKVGEAYDAAIQRGEPPAKSISATTGASQKTVHAWIYQARQRGVIAPAQGKGRIK